MPQSYYKIWIHVMWTTKNSQQLLKKDFRKVIFSHIRQKASAEGCFIDTINGIDDHVHTLLSLNPKYSLSETINKLKGESSNWINSRDFLSIKFAWQRGYSAFSVSESAVSRVRKYINNQEEHHKKASFQEEWNRLLKLHKISIKRT